MRTAIALLVVAGIACAATPAAERVHQVAPGVRVLDTRIGGLASQRALQQVTRAFARPITIVFRGETLTLSPEQLGARADVTRAVRRALEATTRERVPLRITFSESAVSSYVERLARRYDTTPRPARLLGATDRGPLIRTGEVGLRVDRAAMKAALEQALVTGSRAPLVLTVDAVPPRKTTTTFGPVIVINRTANVLRLYSGTRFVHMFHVATGQSIYPTPTGMFHIVVKQLNPWWYPPTYDAWAKGLKPVPPGPGNPLGTRWMGLSVPGVGIHGTDAPGSIGYSASHGCIRMQIPDAEWLFDHVPVGTPVVIL